MPLDLAGDVRLGKGREADTAVEVESIDCLEQAQRSHLDQIVGVESAIRISLRDATHPGEHHRYKFIPRVLVAGLAVASQKRELLLGTNRWIWLVLTQLDVPHANTHMHACRVAFVHHMKNLCDGPAVTP